MCLRKCLSNFTNKCTNFFKEKLFNSFCSTAVLKINYYNGILSKVIITSVKAPKINICRYIYIYVHILLLFLYANTRSDSMYDSYGNRAMGMFCFQVKSEFLQWIGVWGPLTSRRTGRLCHEYLIHHGSFTSEMAINASSFTEWIDKWMTHSEYRIHNISLLISLEWVTL